MRTQGKDPQLGKFVVLPPLEQWAFLWVINCNCVLVEVHRSFSITYAYQPHKRAVEGCHDVARLGKVLRQLR